MITIEEFKTYFKRDFPFLPMWDKSKYYLAGDVVFYETTKLFYTCLKDNTMSEPTNTAEWEINKTEEYFNYINDEDIQKAMNETHCMLPVKLFETECLKIAELYLTAHNLVLSLRIGNAGIGSQFEFPLQSKSVGSVSESYGIPTKFLNNEAYSYYLTSGFGLKYLALLIPRKVGNVGIAYGWTLP